MKIRSRLFAIALGTALIAGSLAAPVRSAVARAEAQSGTLPGTAWSLISYGAPDAATSVIETAQITLLFGADGRVSGKAGCNTYGGEYQVIGDTVSFGRLLTTLMACPEDVLKQEHDYLAILEGVDAYAIAGEALTLTDKDTGQTLVYKPAPMPAVPAPPAAQTIQPAVDLAGTQWKVTSFGAVRRQAKPLRGTELTLNFDAEGKLAGSAGCNRFFGGYAVEGDKLTVSDVAATRKACARTIARQEASYLSALERANRFEVISGTLKVYYAKNAGVINLAPAVPAPAAPAVTPTETTTPTAPIAPTGATTATETAAATLEGTPWVLESLGPAEAATPVLTSTRITAFFDRTEGKVSGSAGCNNYLGTYRFDGDKVTISPLGLTRKACPEEVMLQEQAYLGALQEVARFEIAGDTLKLFVKDGQFVLTYRKEA